MNSRTPRYTRRTTLALMASAALGTATSRGADAPPTIKVSKEPNCRCCNAWVEHLRQHGFSATVVEVTNIQAVKSRLGVPTELASCHTAEIAGYVVEGHVPAAAITRLLAEKPEAIGLAVPSMPAGSPGMEGSASEIYDVILFGKRAPLSFGRFKGDQPV